MSISYAQLESLIKTLPAHSYVAAYTLLSRLSLGSTPPAQEGGQDLSSLLQGSITDYYQEPAKNDGLAAHSGGPGGSDMCPPKEQRNTGGQGGP